MPGRLVHMVALGIVSCIMCSCTLEHMHTRSITISGGRGVPCKTGAGGPDLWTAWRPRLQMNPPLLNLRGGSSDNAVGAGLNPKNVHKTRKMALKAAKASQNETALQRVREGEKALEMGDLVLALEIFEQEIKASSAAVAKPKHHPPPRKPVKAPEVNKDEPTKLHKMRLMLAHPSQNLQAKPIRTGMDLSRNFAQNSNETLQTFLRTFGEQYRTRFPPEPNGFLHIGHAKAMAFNFGQAALAREQGIGGETILRFDDTNPEAEEQVYIDAILEDVAWLGHKPIRVAYTSDYFAQMYDLALQLIDQAQAYTCRCSREEVGKQRAAVRSARQLGLALPEEAKSPFRDTPPEQSRATFEAMRRGEYRDGEVCLRMKGDLASDNPAMWDPILYRVKHHAHPRTGTAWCIYPSYDFSHCIADSIEGITHSCCTLEFASRQAPDGPYYWLLDALGLYKPVTWEYSRCSIVNNVLSKRKLQTLVTGGHVEGWDDPRLLTIAGLRRRGYTPSTINRFCEQIGVSTSLSVSTHQHVLEAVAREELDRTATRVFAVLSPLCVVVTNPEALLKHQPDLENPDPAGPITGYIRVQNHPKNESLGTRLVPFGPELYIQRSDWKGEAVKGYHGLTPGGSVGLVGTNLILHCESVESDAGSETPARLMCSVSERKGAPRPKGNIQWVAKQRAARICVRTYGALLLPEEEEAQAAGAARSSKSASDSPRDDAPTQGGGEEEVVADDSWLRRLNPASMQEETDAVLEESVVDLVGAVQFIREGFFVRDTSPRDGARESTRDPPCFHQVVALKSSYPG